jgi:hypothetical protein
VQQLEEQLRQSQTALKEGQAEHKLEVWVIQQVLANVSTKWEPEMIFPPNVNH